MDRHSFNVNHRWNVNPAHDIIQARGIGGLTPNYNNVLYNARQNRYFHPYRKAKNRHNCSSTGKSTISLFDRLSKNEYNYDKAGSKLTLDEIVSCCKLPDEHIVNSAMASLRALQIAHAKTFPSEIYVKILPIVDALISWTQPFGNNFVYNLNEIFRLIYSLPVPLLTTIFDEICNILCNMLSKQSKIKVLALHVLHKAVFVRCQATMNTKMFYAYLKFLADECVVGKYDVDVVRSGLLTFPDFLEVYLRDNRNDIGVRISAEIRGDKLKIVGREGFSLQEIFPVGIPEVWSMRELYPINSKEGLSVMAISGFKFLGRILSMQNFPLPNYLFYVEKALEKMVKLIERYVLHNQCRPGRYGEAFIKLACDTKFKGAADRHEKLRKILERLSKA